MNGLESIHLNFKIQLFGQYEVEGGDLDSATICIIVMEVE